MALHAKKVFDSVTVKASGVETETAGAQSTAIRLPGMVNALTFVLDVTAAATEVTDTLDVFIQTKIDGTNWVDVIRYTLVLGNGSTKRYVGKVSADVAMTMFENATALGAAAVRDLLGDEWRARWVILETGTASFTFSITACPM